MKVKQRNQSKPNKLLIFSASVCFFLAALVVRLSAFSLNSIVNAQNVFLSGFLSQNPVLSVLSEMFSYFLAPLISLILIVLGLSFLSAYAFSNQKKIVAAISGIAGAASAVVFFGVSFFSAFFALGIVLACLYVANVSNVYGKEYKKWAFFRTGSNSIGKALMIFNILVAIGVVFSIYSSLHVYQENFKTGLVENLVSSVPVPAVQGMDPAALNQELRNYIESTTETSQLFSSLLRWLPVMLGFSVWVGLEFLRTLFLSNIGGVFTSLMLRIRVSFQKENNKL